MLAIGYPLQLFVGEVAVIYSNARGGDVLPVSVEIRATGFEEEDQQRIGRLSGAFIGRGFKSVYRLRDGRIPFSRKFRVTFPQAVQIPALQS